MIYNKDKNRFGRKMKSGHHVENLQNFSCDAVSCQVYVKVARVKGGLLVYKKVDPSTGLPYNHTNHSARPDLADLNNSEFTLSVQQKEEVLKHHDKMSVAAIVHDIIQDIDTTVSKEQKDNVPKFKKVVQDFISRPATKKKYLIHDWQTQDFSTSVVKEILDSVMSPGTDLPCSNTNEFMGSKLFQTIFENINLLEHNFCDNGEKDIVFFESNTIAQIFELARRMFEHEIGKKKSAIQFSGDSTHIPGTNYVLGMCGIDDFRHRIWPTSFIICNTESGHKARKISGRMVDLINADLRGNIDKSLIDGAQALRSACVDLGVDPRNCFTHVNRLPLTRGGGKVGSKGSFANYLVQTMKKSYANSAKVSTTFFYQIYPFFYQINDITTIM